MRVVFETLFGAVLFFGIPFLVIRFEKIAEYIFVGALGLAFYGGILFLCWGIGSGILRFFSL